MTDLKKIQTLWNDLSKFLFVPRTEEDYERLISNLNELLDEVGNDETHSLASLMDVMGSLIEVYENENVPEPSPGFEFKKTCYSITQTFETSYDQSRLIRFDELTPKTKEDCPV